MLHVGAEETEEKEQAIMRGADRYCLSYGRADERRKVGENCETRIIPFQQRVQNHSTWR